MSLILHYLNPKLLYVPLGVSISDMQQNPQLLHSDQYFIKSSQQQKINVLDIPETDVPYKIPGTRIGVLTGKPLNERVPKVDDLNALLAEVNGGIETVKQEIAAQSCGQADRAFESFKIITGEINLLSAKQQTTLLNQLVNLRKELRAQYQNCK